VAARGIAGSRSYCRGCSEAADRDRGEQAELALKVFELSKALVEKRLAADPPAKRQLLRYRVFELVAGRHNSLLRHEKAL